MSIEETLPLAPLDWRYWNFPLAAPGEERMEMAAVVAEMERRVACTERTGDHTPIGPVLHWAHILKATQAADGSWASAINARTGEEIGGERTREPAGVLDRLADILDSTEFDSVIERARAGALGTDAHVSRTTGDKSPGY